MTDEYLVPPNAPPNLEIPPSTSTVKVSCVDSTTHLKLPMAPFLVPNYKGKDYMTGPSFGFLIQHPSGKQIVFDLGVRKDWQNLPKAIAAKIKDNDWEVSAQKNMAEVLQENGIDVAGGAVDAVVWSHHHWDHVGDMGTFPKQTDLIVGPGLQKEYLPGYPERQDSPIRAEDFRDRTVREINPEQDGKGLKLGRYWAFDYFGDGSFYLLDTPGHSVGHICGLARTTGGEQSTFVLMGGDACHHAGEFRPTQYLPLPAELDPSPLPSLRVCPGELLTAFHRSADPTEPYYKVTEKFAHDLDECEWTIDGIEEFDAQDNVLVVIAHDESVVEELDLFPKTMNDWHEKGLARKVRWNFLKDFDAAATGSSVKGHS